MTAAAAAIESVEVSDGAAQIAWPQQRPRGLVVFVHGASQLADAPTTDPQDAVLSAALLRDGWAVASADAGGNAWGSQGSVDTYLELSGAVRPRVSGPTVVLAQSMGGLAGLQVADQLPGVRAFAGIYPVCNLASAYRHPVLRDQIDDEYGDTAAAQVERLSAPAVDAQVPMLVWGSTTDTLVPAADNAQVCVERVSAAGGSAKWVPTVGEHGDWSNFDPARLTEFFDQAR